MQIAGLIMDLFKGADAAEREGHKYISRQWNGSHWEYEYSNTAGEGPQGGVQEVEKEVQVRDNRGGEARTRVAKILQAHRNTVEAGATKPGTPPEQAYKEAVKAALSQPGQKVQMEHRAFGTPINVEIRDGKYVVSRGDAQADVEFASQKAKTVAKQEKSFDSHASFELWYLKSSNTVGFYGPDGKPWLNIVPSIGKPDKEKDEINWTSDPDRQWKIEYHPLYAGAQTGNFGFARSYDHAVQQVSSEFNQRADASGGTRMDPAAILAKYPNPAAMPSRDAAQEAHAKGEEPPTHKPGEPEKLSAEEKSAYESKDAKEMPEAKPGSTAEFMQTKATWGYDESRPKGDRRKLQVSDKEKQKLVNDVAHEFWPAIIAHGDRHLNTAWTRDKRDEHMDSIVGAAGVDKYLATRTPDRSHVFLDPASPVARAISSALDNYDPKNANNTGFAGYLVGLNGKVSNAFRDAVKPLKTEEGTLTHSRTTNARHGPGEERAASAQQKEEREDYLDPEEHAVTEQHRDPKVVAQTLTPLITKWAMANPEKKVIIDKTKAALRAIRGTSNKDTQQQHMSELLQVLTDDPPHGAGMVSDLSKLLGKSLSNDEHAFLQWMVSRDLVIKAMAVLTKDKNADPTHEYSHREGDEDNPKYFWKDPNGNLVRYTNAPQGNEDRGDQYGDAKVHPGEPTMDKNPEYFDPLGRKLTRAPEDPATTEWNRRYNQYDPKNMWVGRWRDPNNGEYRYTYVHSDLRMLPKLQIHQQNALTDVRVPPLRQYVAKLFNSSTKVKDQMTAVAVALLDQGKMRAIELSALTPDVVLIEGNLITLGGRKVFGCPKMVAAMDMLKRSTPGGMPLFSAPQQLNDKVNPLVRRIMGPHYLARVVDMQGVSLLGLQTYHGTISFSREADRAIVSYQASWEQACSHALMVVAKEWGHDLSVEPDPLRILQLVSEVLVDPVVMRVMQQNAQEQRLIGAQPSPNMPPPAVPIPFVQIDAVDRNAEEQEFSQWIHSVSLHDYAQFPEEIPEPATAVA